MATNESTKHVLMMLQRIQVEIKISFTRIWARRKMKKKIFDFGAFFIHTLWPYMVMIEKNSKSIFKLYCTNYSCHKTCFPMSSDFDQQPEQRNWANFLQYKWIGFDILVYFLVTQTGSSLLSKEFDCFEDGKIAIVENCLYIWIN